MSLFMGLVDLIPVMLFAASAVMLQRGLYERLSKGAFALLCSGTIMVIAAGLYKALWKILYGAGICDFTRLNQAFFPMEATGFLLSGFAGLALILNKREKGGEKLLAAAPAVFSGTMVFVSMMILGVLGFCTGLAAESKREGKKKAAVLYWVSFAFMLMMGYLSSKDFTRASMNWIAQGVNIAGQAVFFMAGRELLGKA